VISGVKRLFLGICRTMEKKNGTRVRRASEANVLQEQQTFLSQQPTDDEPLQMNRCCASPSWSFYLSKIWQMYDTVYLVYNYVLDYLGYLRT